MKKFFRKENWVDEYGHDYRIPLVISIIGLATSTAAILMKLFH